MTDVLDKLLAAADRLRDEFDAEPDLATAHRLVAAWERICAADPDPDHRNELGNALLDRYEWTADAADAERAVACYAEAAAGTDPPDSGYLNNLGLALRRSYVDNEDETLLDRSVEALGRAVTAAGAEDLPVAVDNLERSLTLLDQTGHHLARLNRSIDGWRQIARLGGDEPAERARRHAQLGAALYRRWEVTGDQADLRDAGDAYAAVPPEECPALANDLGVHHYYQHRARRDRADLDAAVTWSRLAAAGGDPLARANLGRALRGRHELTGIPAELDEAIELLSGVPADVVVPLDLANALLTRFETRGDLTDLASAVELFARTTDDLPAGHPDQAAAHNDLANALRTRFTHTRDAADLSRARAALAAALECAGTNPDRYLYLDNLGNTLVDELTMSGDNRRLADALRLFDEASALLADSPERRRVLGNRAGVFWYQWEAGGDQADLERAVAAFGEVAASTPPGETGRAVRFNNLAVALIAATSDMTDPAAAQRIRAAFGEAFTGEDTLWRLRAAREWGRWAGAGRQWTEAAEVYGRALDAMGELFRLQHGRRDKEWWLCETAGMTVEAGYAYRAATGGREAVARLEAGRGLLLSEALSSLDRELDRLAQAGHDGIVRRYQRAAALLAARERASEERPVPAPCPMPMRSFKTR